MKEMKCPHCGKTFSVDPSDYESIAQQVRDEEFQRAVQEREHYLTQSNQQALELAELQYQAEKEQALAKKEQELQELRAALAQNEVQIQLAVAQVERERDAALAERKQYISELEFRLQESGQKTRLEVAKVQQERDKALSEKETELVRLQMELQHKDTERRQETDAMRMQYEEKIRAGEAEHNKILQIREEELQRLKDFKAKQSTKMVGESLEQHCQDEFNKLRMTAFPHAYFEKDNDARTGSKGDFIFREQSEDGVEFLSIMFEMKNEMETTATKHKNENFLKELDKDRREKGCEYAVLVSLLESDSDYYNSGIVDVSYAYPKMYVIRPQFFIPMITLLRNAALRSLDYQRELAVVRNQQIDLTHFEENMTAFKDSFSRNYRLASERFQDAIEEIDKSIQHLQKIKEQLLKSENNLRLANHKAEELTIKRLTKNAPSVREQLEALQKTTES